VFAAAVNISRGRDMFESARSADVNASAAAFGTELRPQVTTG
jgi:post-segregation antitoxin (ccd killing protein)